MKCHLGFEFGKDNAKHDDCNTTVCSDEMFTECHDASLQQPKAQRVVSNEWLSGKTVVCELSKRCGEAVMCGGARPHIYDQNECGKCPMDSGAKCVAV